MRGGITDAMGIRARNRLLLVVGAAISVLFLWLAVRDTDIMSIRLSIADAKLTYIPFMLVSIVLFFGFKTARWGVLLSPIVAVRTTQLYPVVVVGYASNILLPAQLGELVRTYLACRKYRVSGGPVLVTVILERMFDFLTILLFVALIVPFERNVPEELVLAGYLCGGIGLVMVGLATLHALRPSVLGRVFGAMISILPRRFRAPLERQFDLATQGLASLRNLRSLTLISLTSIVQWLLMGICTWLAIVSLGIEVPVSAAYVVLAVVVAGMTIPSSPGFFGTIQLCFTIGLSPFGVNAAQAFAASIVFHGVMFVSVALGGLFFLHRLGYSAAHLYHETESADLATSESNT